jgi:glutathionylspermidine amidase/synthetase
MHRNKPIIKGYAPHRIPIYENPAIEYDIPHHWGRKGTQYEGLFYGVKYECVEFIRRYYIHVYGITFREIDNAIDLFRVPHGTDVKTKRSIPFQAIRNAPNQIPHQDDVVIWKQEGPYQKTGHVAIVVEVLSPHLVRIVEQNGTTKDGWRTIRIHHPGIIGWIRPITSDS